MENENLNQAAALRPLIVMAPVVRVERHQIQYNVAYRLDEYKIPGCQDCGRVMKSVVRRWNGYYLCTPCVTKHKKAGIRFKPQVGVEIDLS